METCSKDVEALRCHHALAISRGDVDVMKERKERKTTQAAESSSHQLRKWSHLGRKTTSPEKKRGD